MLNTPEMMDISPARRNAPDIHPIIGKASGLSPGMRQLVFGSSGSYRTATCLPIGYVATSASVVARFAYARGTPNTKVLDSYCAEPTWYRYRTSTRYVSVYPPPLMRELSTATPE